MSQDPVTADNAQLKGFLAFLNTHKAAIEKRIQQTVSVDRLIAIAYTAATKTPKLLLCPFESIVNSLIRAGQLGIEPETALKHAYLIPRWNAKIQKNECQLQVSYTGLIYIAHKSKAVKAVWSDLVYDNDAFDAPRGHNPDIIHRRNLREPGEIYAVYAVATLPDGSKVDAIMSRAEVEAIRDGSNKGKPPESGPWFDHFGEMAKKTSIIRLMKTIPMGPGLAEALEDDEDIIDTVGEAVPAKAVPVASGRAAKVLEKAGKAAGPAQLPAPGDRVPVADAVASEEGVTA